MAKTQINKKFKQIEDISELNLIVMKKVPLAARYELVAEEATELAHSSLKIARILRKENPTPKTITQAKKEAEEELNDLINAIQVTEDLRIDLGSRIRKMKRWIKRLEEKEAKDGDHGGTP